jgi:hypothetical protein
MNGGAMARGRGSCIRMVGFPFLFDTLECLALLFSFRQIPRGVDGTTWLEVTQGCRYEVNDTYFCRLFFLFATDMCFSACRKVNF